MHSEPNQPHQSPDDPKEKLGDISENIPNDKNNDQIKVEYSHEDKHWVIRDKQTGQILCTGHLEYIRNYLDHVQFIQQLPPYKPNIITRLLIATINKLRIITYYFKILIIERFTLK